MNDSPEQHALPALVTAEDGTTAWDTRAWPQEVRGGMVLSPRIGCSSLRLRESEPGYRANWHVAGEPVLIVIRKGVLRIELRDGSTRDFGPGDAFIAADRLEEGQVFDDALHGHRAQVVGDQTLAAVHIKLDAREADD